MALLRKYIRDDAGRRVPVYRTGLWPWRLPHEHRVSHALLRAMFRETIGTARYRAGLFFRAVLTALFACLTLAVAMGYFHPLGVARPPGPFAGDHGLLGMSCSAVLAVVLGLDLLRWARFGSRRHTDRLRAAMLNRGRCPSCGYESNGATPCPECGSTWQVTKAQGNEPEA